MAALLAQRQSMLMSASTASGIKIPGNQPLQNMNSLAENLSAGSGGVSERAKGINNSGIQLAGQHYNEVRHLDLNRFLCLLHIMYIEM